MDEYVHYGMVPGIRFFVMSRCTDIQTVPDTNTTVGKTYITAREVQPLFGYIYCIRCISKPKHSDT